jgi:putative transposase
MVFHASNRGVGRRRLFAKERDYAAFEEIIEKTLLTCPMRICSYCLMPNHWHFVLWPESDGQLGAFMQKPTVTHVRNWQEHRRRVGEGHVYQGRYKSFPVQTDGHFYRLARYVERNCLRANLVDNVVDWRWSSLWRRLQGPRHSAILSPWPVAYPRDWVALVNEPQTEAEVEALRRSVQRGQPYGADTWVKETARTLGLESTLRRPGRPRKQPGAEGPK